MYVENGLEGTGRGKCTYVDATLTLPQLPPPPPRVLKSILYVYVFIPALPLGSSEPFFFLDPIYMCYSICFSLSDLLHSV